MMVEDKIDQATTLEELYRLRLEVIQTSKLQIEEDPNCLDSHNRTPVQRQFIKKKFELETGIRCND